MSAPVKVDIKDFFYNRPYCVDNAVGFVAQLGLNEHLRERDELIADFQVFFDACEVSAAWECYELDWLITDERLASGFPRWHDVDGRVNFALASQILSDYTNITTNFYKEQTGWQQVDHVCAFIIRLQAFRMRQEKERSLKPWSIADHWAAAYLLYELLHWIQVDYQKMVMLSIKTANPTLAGKIKAALESPPDTIHAPVIRSQAPPPSFLAWLQFWTRY
jgi:hypothetical protein